VGQRPAPARKQLHRSDIPVLFLSGEYDPATPSHWAKHVATRFNAGQFVLFRGIGHDVIDTEACGSDVVSDFLADPKRKIETDCVAKLEPPDFISIEDE
jgi:pimeloyl-ACP methyl ester carboxylesterase